ncbi:MULTISPECIES: hypothetical protein [unclassified Chitinophaga]|uniref:hypothetical protein n=1 Tax=unclassified Chitinophaga TaxID=2619133 RepID=UPI0009F96205|nr:MULTISPECIES: hypothetical protein [unclassified Chitinophaga]WPV67892.1 hypothetical protein QQL36_04035 [Chitinophaga sp. LS1]
MTQNLKLSLMTLAVVIGAGSAIASSFTRDHREETQYYKYGNNYYEAGVEGYDYECQFDHFGTCTYYFDAATGTYKSSKAGKIVWIR